MCRSVVDAVKRPQHIEDRRNMLTCQLKNMVLYHLTNFKAAKRRPSFKEIIAQVVQKKKDDMKKDRKKRHAQLVQGVLSHDDEFEGDEEFSGLNKEQTSYIMEQFARLKQRFTTNN